MNFFKSVFSDDPDPQADPVPSAVANAAPSAASAATWDFGGLLKTISAKSESVIDTYRRDFQEFGTGLRKEIEAAQGSLEGVGHVFDDLGSVVLKGTAQIINQGKDSILAADALVKSDQSDHPSPAASASNPSYKVNRRFEAQVRALQGDVWTFDEEPEDAEDYSEWKLRFDLGAKRGEIENLVETNEAMMGIYERLVPGKIDDGTFWLRYFYRVHKLQQADSLRANLVKRAILSEKEEELSWDVYDEEEEEEEKEIDDKGVKLSEKGGDSSGVAMVEGSLNKATIPTSSVAEVEDGGVAVAHGEVDTVNADKPMENAASTDGSEHSVVEPVKETGIEGNADKETDVGANAKNSEKESSQNENSAKKADKESDSEVLPSRPIGSEEEDLGWDEIEDLSSIDDNGTSKVGQDGDPSPNREELRKRLSAADEEEDLSWDIEDNEEPAKA